jgi:hypothetical protein
LPLKVAEKLGKCLACTHRIDQSCLQTEPSQKGKINSLRTPDQKVEAGVRHVTGTEAGRSWERGLDEL